MCFKWQVVFFFVLFLSNSYSDSQLAPEFHKGVTLGGAHWRKDEYKNLDWTLDKAIELGVSHALVIPNGFVYPGKTGHEIRKVFFEDPLYGKDPRFQTQKWGWWGASLSDEQIREIAKNTKKCGMKFVLKPHIDPWDGSSRGALRPSNPEAFYANYTKFIVHYAKLAEELDASLLVIGTELSDVTSTRGALARRGVDVTQAWRSIIQEVRKVYRGKITYSASAFGDWKTWRKEDIGKDPSYVGVWDALDYIGFEPYFGVTTKNDPNLDELVEGFTTQFNLYARPLAEKHNKKILLTEVNAYAFDGMNTDPIAMYTSPEEHKIDHQEQADYYEALFRSISRLDYIKGSYLWPLFLKPSGVPDDEAYWKLQKKSHRDSLLGVPAGDVVKKWYKKRK